MENSLSEHARDMRSRVYRHMLETRGWKYRAFLRYLRLFKYLSFSRYRGSFLESYYTLMRYLDDIVDGDAPLPGGYPDSAGYIMQKILFSEDRDDPRDAADFLMLHCFELADRIGEDFTSETQDILGSLLFDAHRRGSLHIFPEIELSRHFHLLDVRGTIRATLKVFNEDPDKYLLLEPLGLACRYQYDLEDFTTDIQAGYVNISREECDVMGIRPHDHFDPTAAGVRRWFRYRALRGLALLEEHTKRLPKGRFSLLSRMTFPLVYANPARKCFTEVMQHTREVQIDHERLFQMINARSHEKATVLSE